MAFYMCTNLEGTISLGNCEQVNNSAFTGCSKISKVVMNSVKVIEEFAFSETGIKSMEINLLQVLGDYAFADCLNLNSFNYKSAVRSGSHCFENDPIDQISIPENFIVEKYAFYGLKDLKTITMPSYIINISDYAFYQCSSLESIDLSNCETVGEHAFDGCSSLSSINNPENVKLIDTAAFANSKIKTLPNISNGVVKSFAFANCSLSGNVNLSSGILKCASLSYDISVPDSDIPLIAKYYKSRFDSCVQHIIFGNKDITGYNVPKDMSDPSSTTFFQIIDNILMVVNSSYGTLSYEVVAYPPTKSRTFNIEDLYNKLPSRGNSSLDYIQPYALSGEKMEITLPSDWSGSEVDTDAFIGLKSAVVKPDYAYDIETYGDGSDYSGKVTIIMPYDDSGRFVHSSTSQGKSINTAAIAGGSVGGAVGIAGAVFGGIFLKKKRGGGSQPIL